MAPIFTGSKFGFGRSADASGPIGPFVSATGGNIVIEPGNGYRYHTFTSPGILTATSAGTAEVFLIGGGGGGGSTPGQTGGGGGGGSGGYFYGSFPITPGSYPVGVGTSGVKNTTGGDSTFFTYFTAKGGGGGGFQGTAGKPGGSGGGGAGATPDAKGNGIQPATPSTFPEIARGGSGAGPGDIPLTSGGGGGGAAGGGNSASFSGTGGPGVQFPQFSGPLIGIPALAPLSGYYGGGGGGGRGPSGPSGGGGGIGGGGSGSQAPASSPAATPGVQYSGGGGGGGGKDDAKPGGQGIVVVRYLVQ